MGTSPNSLLGVYGHPNLWNPVEPGQPHERFPAERYAHEPIRRLPLNRTVAPDCVFSIGAAIDQCLQTPTLEGQSVDHMGFDIPTALLQLAPNFGKPRWLAEYIWYGLPNVI
jgi:hypothetical protein